jgi:hypothetical protein
MNLLYDKNYLHAKYVTKILHQTPKLEEENYGYFWSRGEWGDHEYIGYKFSLEGKDFLVYWNSFSQEFNLFQIYPASKNLLFHRDRNYIYSHIIRNTLDLR